MHMQKMGKNNKNLLIENHIVGYLASQEIKHATAILKVADHRDPLCSNLSLH